MRCTTGSSTLQLTALWMLLMLACMNNTYGYPAIYVARYQKQCTDHPASAFGKVHDYSSAVDRSVAFSLQNKATGKAVKPANGVSSICSGDTYLVKLAFGEPSLRNYLLTSSHGSFVVKSNDCDEWCPNRVCSSAPTKVGSSLFSLPCSVADGTKVTFKVTSANGRIPALGAELRSASLTLKVDSKCGRCSSVTEERAKTSSLRG